MSRVVQEQHKYHLKAARNRYLATTDDAFEILLQRLINQEDIVCIFWWECAKSFEEDPVMKNVNTGVFDNILKSQYLPNRALRRHLQFAMYERKWKRPRGRSL